ACRLWHVVKASHRNCLTVGSTSGASITHALTRRYARFEWQQYAGSSPLVSQSLPLLDHRVRAHVRSHDLASATTRRRVIAMPRIKARLVPATQAVQPSRSNVWPNTALPTRPPKK